MNELEAKDIVERLRKAQQAGAPVEELLGSAARDFQHVKHEHRRPVLLGSFLIKAASTPFFVSVVSKVNRHDAFQLFVNKKLRAFPRLVTDRRAGDRLLWRYTPTKRTGDNAARQAAFLKTYGSLEMEFPVPEDDVSRFAEAVQRALLARQDADDTEDVDDAEDDDSVDGDDSADAIAADLRSRYDATNLATAIEGMATAIREAHAIAPGRWSVTWRKDRELLRLNVGTARVFDLGAETLALAVNTDDLSPDDTATLGPRLERPDSLAVGRFGPNAVVVAPPAEFMALLPRLLPAYRSLVTRAGKTAALHQRHHNPEVLAALRTLSNAAIPEPTLATLAARTAYWKVSPGEGGSDWERCKAQGFIGVGWEDVGDLRLLTRAAFDARVQQLGHKPGVEAIWKFKDIRVGDRIVANAGTTRVLGIGTVTGPYFFIAGEHHGHRLPVEWTDVTERTVNMKGWRQTLIRLTEATFEEISTAPPVDDTDERVDDEAGPDGGIDFDGILAHLETKSLAFPAETVATYLLALQAGRFVLLTGISGTGKTQLALEVARLFAPDARGAPKALAADGAAELTIQTDHVKRGRFVVPVRLAKELDALYDEQTNRINVRLPGRQAESMSIYKDSARPNLLIVGLSGEAKTAFQRIFTVGSRAVLRREATDRTETLVVDLPDSRHQPVGEVTHELVAVRPDWTDARALTGFYNPLTKSYVSTPALDLLRQAQSEVERASASALPPRPFFLLFDEMNLARVEHYFSDFLSAMESGEEIHLHDDDDLADAEENPVPKRIKIPKNVFVVGTVNVDETTYMFSPKVLDRAFVIEFNHVDLDALSGRASGDGDETTTLALAKMGAGLRLLGKPDDEEWTRFETALDGEFVRTLKAIHGALAVDNRHFGYRVAREIARFVDLAREQTDGSPAALRTAFDVAVLAKVLPKLHGGQAEIERPLQNVFHIVTGTDNAAPFDLDGFAPDGVVLTRADGVPLPLPRTALKLWRMRQRLRTQGFVSFIE